jgi:hypothetical protein
VRRRKKKLEEISAKHVQGILFVDRIVKMIGHIRVKQVGGQCFLLQFTLAELF